MRRVLGTQKYGFPSYSVLDPLDVGDHYAINKDSFRAIGDQSYGKNTYISYKAFLLRLHIKCSLSLGPKLGSAHNYGSVMIKVQLLVACLCTNQSSKITET